MDNKLFNELLESTKQMGEIMHDKCKPARVFYFQDIEIIKLRKEVDSSETDFTLLK